jgi:hypothetical protein
LLSSQQEQKQKQQQYSFKPAAAAAAPTWDGKVPAQAVSLDLVQALGQRSARAALLGPTWAADGAHLAHLVNADVGEAEEHIALTAGALQKFASKQQGK